jgi:hypothetical protein
MHGERFSRLFGLKWALVNNIWGGLKSIVNRPDATMPIKTRKATTKARTSAPGRADAKLVAPPTNGPALLGYARVSTSDQDTHIQQAKLRDAGCAVIRAEKASGKARDGRSELEVVMSFVRPGDTLVVVKLDRLGRSTRDVLNLVHELEQGGAALRCVAT